jgi:hypothetical protein
MSVLADHASHKPTWLAALRRYIVFIVLVNFLWEIAQLPLYTIWQTGTVRELVFAVIHCTGGDVLIASASLLGALLLLGNCEWPNRRYAAVTALAVIAGVSYAIFSEWLNTAVRGSWAYSDLMPTVPVIGSGVSPLTQWLLVPLAAALWARRRATVRPDARTPQ